MNTHKPFGSVIARFNAEIAFNISNLLLIFLIDAQVSMKNASKVKFLIV